MQAKTIYQQDDIQGLKKELMGGGVALCIFNSSGKQMHISLDIKKDLGLWAPYKKIYNILENKTEQLNPKISGTLEGHDCKVFLINP
jgi:hypothetical protein